MGMEGSIESEEKEKEKKTRYDVALFMGMKVRRRASIFRECRGDYIGVSSDPYLAKILSKQEQRFIYRLQENAKPHARLAEIEAASRPHEGTLKEAYYD